MRCFPTPLHLPILMPPFFTSASASGVIQVLQLSALRATLVPHDRAGWTLRHGEAFSLLVRPTVNPVRQTTRPCPCPCPCLQAATIGLQAATLPFQAAIVRLQAVIHSSPGRDPWAFRLPPSRVHALAVPRRTQVLSSYVTDLTGISQLELNRSGVPFAEAMGRTPRVARTPGQEARALTLPDLLRLATRSSLLAPRSSLLAPRSSLLATHACGPCRGQACTPLRRAARSSHGGTTGASCRRATISCSSRCPSPIPSPSPNPSPNPKPHQANYDLLQQPLPWPQWPADMLDVRPLFEAAGVT